MIPTIIAAASAAAHKDESGGLSTIAAVGIGIGVLLVILIAMWFFVRWWRNWPY